MFCKNCGSQIDDNAVVCPHCGVPTGTRGIAPENERRSNNFAIAGFVLSFFIALLGLIFSILGLRKAGECGGSGRGLSIAGIIIAILNMIGAVIIYAVTFSEIAGSML